MKLDQVLSVSCINQNLLNIEYAVRGPIVQRALQIERELQKIITNTTKEELAKSVQPFTRDGVTKGNRDSFFIYASIRCPLYRNLTQKMTTQAIQCTCRSAYKNIPKVDIDATGTFNYLLIKVFQNVEDGCHEPKFFTIVRGYQKCKYHFNIYDEVSPFLRPFDSVPFGGGKINHEPKCKRIKIYGYSETYGKADHKIAAKLIKEAYPCYSVSISNREH